MKETTITDKPQITYSECYNQPFFKVCSKCGVQKLNDEYSKYFYKPKKDGTKKIGIRTYCNSCKNKMVKDWFEINNDYKKEYRKRNPEKLKEENLRAKPRTEKWRLENKDILKIKKIEYKKKNIIHIAELNKKEAQKTRDLLTDRYVVSQITKRSSLKAEDIKENKELIEVKRLIIKTKRLWKTSRN
jgi:hypothetical protein